MTAGTQWKHHAETMEDVASVRLTLLILPPTSKAGYAAEYTSLLVLFHAKWKGNMDVIS